MVATDKKTTAQRNIRAGDERQALRMPPIIDTYGVRKWDELSERQLLGQISRKYRVDGRNKKQRQVDVMPKDLDRLVQYGKDIQHIAGINDKYAQTDQELVTSARVLDLKTIHERLESFKKQVNGSGIKPIFNLGAAADPLLLEELQQLNEERGHDLRFSATSSPYLERAEILGLKRTYLTGASPSERAYKAAIEQKLDVISIGKDSDFELLKELNCKSAISEGWAPTLQFVIRVNNEKESYLKNPTRVSEFISDAKKLGFSKFGVSIVVENGEISENQENITEALTKAAQTFAKHKTSLEKIQILGGLIDPQSLMERGQSLDPVSYLSDINKFFKETIRKIAGLEKTEIEMEIGNFLVDDTPVYAQVAKVDQGRVNLDTLSAYSTSPFNMVDPKENPIRLKAVVRSKGRGARVESVRPRKKFGATCDSADVSLRAKFNKATGTWQVEKADYMLPKLDRGDWVVVSAKVNGGNNFNGHPLPACFVRRLDGSIVRSNFDDPRADLLTGLQRCLDGSDGRNGLEFTQKVNQVLIDGYEALNKEGFNIACGPAESEDQGAAPVSKPGGWLSGVTARVRSFFRLFKTEPERPAKKFIKFTPDELLLDEGKRLDYLKLAFKAFQKQHPEFRGPVTFLDTMILRSALALGDVLKNGSDPACHALDEICPANKTHNDGIIAWFQRMVGFNNPDIASAGERDLVEASGGTTDGGIMSHPAPSRETVRQICSGKLKVSAITIDSKDILDTYVEEGLLNHVRDNPQFKVFIRIKTTGNLATKFGAEAAEALSLVKEAHKAGFKNLGFAFHVGTQNHTAEPYRIALDGVARLIKKAKRLHGITVKNINIGGGLCDGETARKNGTDLQRLAKDLAKVVSAFRGRMRRLYGGELFRDLQDKERDPWIMSEMGRYFIASAGSYVVPVSYGSNETHTRQAGAPDTLRVEFDLAGEPVAQLHDDRLSTAHLIEEGSAETPRGKFIIIGNTESGYDQKLKAADGTEVHDLPALITTGMHLVFLERGAYHGNAGFNPKGKPKSQKVYVLFEPIAGHPDGGEFHFFFGPESDGNTVINQRLRKKKREEAEARVKESSSISLAV
jgi:diaminopimelate decarboxylase